VVEAPVIAHADKGGYRFAPSFDPTGLKGSVTARLHGFWGFDAFEGPKFAAQFPQDDDWQVAPGQRLQTGRKNNVLVTGPSLACVRDIAVQLPDGRNLTADWQMKGERLSIDIPLSDLAAPGDVRIAIQPYGGGKPAVITIPAEAEDMA
jgi:hypothetical protein